MFEPSDRPRIFGLPPGADFPAALVGGCLDLMKDRPPEALARVTIYVNTRRMLRRVRDLFADGNARLFPRIRLITEIGADPTLTDVPLPVSPIRRRLELSRLVKRLIDADPTLAPEGAVFDLADSLAALMDEMQGEGVSMEDVTNLDISDASGHWERSQAFLSIVGAYLASDSTDAPDPEARQRLAVEHLAQRWKARPPADPILVAGSTGSRGTTMAFMEAVASLPQGALLLPGYDTNLPNAVWERLNTPGTAEDHPQFRFARLFQILNLSPQDVLAWPGSEPPAPDRNRLLSLALRPAPVTNQWMTDGPALGDVSAFCQGLTLIEAPSPRAEAETIAYLLREAAEQNRKAALVTPDRVLTRRVTALLDRWALEPDDSAGRPLALSPSGRLLRQAAALIEERPTLESLLSLLKHPLVHTGDGRGSHLRNTRALELWLRAKGIPWPSPDLLDDWRDTPGPWRSWIAEILKFAPKDGETPLPDLIDHHLAVVERLVAGHSSTEAGRNWEKPDGRKSLEVMTDLSRNAVHGDPMTARDYVRLLQSVLNQAEVRDPIAPHTSIMIWGTLEARVQGADLVILGGLNEDTWPETPAPDPWLNRKMRLDAGLLLPERRIGLSAHDFQQAIAAPTAVLTRAIRNDTAQPVPSRWLNRLTNLLEGLSETGGPDALASMRDRGKQYLIRADLLNKPTNPVAPESRPSPRPPVALRPRRLSFTEVERLIRDPYAIYARHVLGLRKLDPLNPEPDARIRGRILHDIFDRFMAEWRDEAVADPRTHLLQVAAKEIAKASHWPVASRMLMARIEQVAPWFIQEETKHQGNQSFLISEIKGQADFPEVDFTLYGRADRIDRLSDGTLLILDYKSGTPPSEKDMKYFDVQLLLEALIAEAGGFDGLEPATVTEVGHIGLGSSPKRTQHLLIDPDKQEFSTASIRARFLKLIAAYDQRGRGYTSRRAMQKMRFDGDYDHLARYGEWDDSADPEGRDIG